MDVSCYLQLGKTGPKHADCGGKCVRNGQPIGLLTSSKELYLVIPEEHHPRRDGQTNIREAFATDMGNQVKVTGMVQKTPQGKAIFVSNMEVQKPGPESPCDLNELRCERAICPSTGGFSYLLELTNQPSKHFIRHQSSPIGEPHSCLRRLRPARPRPSPRTPHETQSSLRCHTVRRSVQVDSPHHAQTQEERLLYRRFETTGVRSNGAPETYCSKLSAGREPYCIKSTTTQATSNARPRQNRDTAGASNTSDCAATPTPRARSLKSHTA